MWSEKWWWWLIFMIFFLICWWYAHRVRPTGVTIQFRVDNVDFAVFFRFFRCFRRPCAGHQVIGAPVFFKANQVERNGAELSRATALQKHHLVVAWDVSVRTNVFVLKSIRRADVTTSSIKKKKKNQQQMQFLSIYYVILQSCYILKLELICLRLSKC